MSGAQNTDDKSESNPRPSPDKPPLCFVCRKAPAAGVGPFSLNNLCQEHLAVDVAEVMKLRDSVDEELRRFFESGTSSTVVAPGTRPLVQELQISGQLKCIENECLLMQGELDNFYQRVQLQIKEYLNAVRTCHNGLNDTQNYRQEVAAAEAAGNISEIAKLSMSMQLSIPDLQAEFDLAQRLRLENDCVEMQLRRFRQIEKLVGSVATDRNSGVTDAAVSALPDVRDAESTASPTLLSAAVTARPIGIDIETTVAPEVCDASLTASDSPFDPIVFSHQVPLNGQVDLLTVCSDTRGFVGEPSSGLVVSINAAGDDREALPEPCIFARVSGCSHLRVLSVDGARRLRCQGDFDFKQNICSLHCDRQQLFIAQRSSVKVTVTDLSGRVVFQIEPQIEDFDEIRGISCNATNLFISCDNKIAVLHKLIGQLETVITLPGALDMRNLTVYRDSIMVVDCESWQVHKVHIDSQQLVCSYPSDASGLQQFAWPMDVAVDRRGRLFMSENDGHSVRAVAADDGSLLWTLGTPGESGFDGNRLNRPWGLAVATGGPREQLVVADYLNSRLLVIDVDS